MAPQAPQLALSLCKSEHVALFPLPQSVVLESQPHLAPLQCVLPGHTRPQPPQLASSVLMAAQEPLQAISSGPQLETHLLLEHSQPMSHAVPHAPQFAGSPVKSEQDPPQFVVPCGHAHLPAVHVAVLLQTTPQPPQLVVSLRMSTHAPAQKVSWGDEQES